MIKIFRKKKEEPKIANSIKKPMEQAAENTQPAGSTDAEDMDELIAVIAAAVAASLNRTTHDIIVRSVKRIPSVSPAWNRAARLDLTAPKLY